MSPDRSGSGVRRARFVVSYHGAPFHGFAPNAGLLTVMGELTAAIATVARHDVALSGAGRTDAGVHAWGQVVSGDLPEGTDLADLVRRVNKLCAPHIAVRSGEWAEPGFDARFSATWRRYRYHVWNDPAPNPLLAGTVWHVPRSVDVAAMDEGSRALVGEHDFASFCRRPRVVAGRPEPSFVRIMYELGWRRVGESSLLRFEVRGSAFCHQQVRSMVGMLVDVGLGRIEPAEVAAILARRDRSAAGQVAPPHGLILWEVGYDGRRWDGVRWDADPLGNGPPRP